MTNIVVRKAEFLDIDVGVSLGRELNGTERVDWLPCGPDRIARLAQGWLASRNYAVLVAEKAEAAEYETWPASLAEARERRRKNMLGFFVGYRHRNGGAEWLANDVAIFVRPELAGYLAAARLMLRFIDWSRERRCREVCFGAAAAAVIRAGALDPAWLGLSAMGPYYCARLTSPRAELGPMRPTDMRR
jgi:GNAT superfamily N-acetyltransferase